MSAENEALIMELENIVQARIPEECKELIINFGGKRLERNRFVRVVNERFHQGMTINKVEGIREIIDSWDYVKDVFAVEDHKIMHFGETLGSPLICIGLSENNYGKIFVFDFDFGLTRVAESLDDFLKSLE